MRLPLVVRAPRPQTTPTTDRAAYYQSAGLQVPDTQCEYEHTFNLVNDLPEPYAVNGTTARCILDADHPGDGHAVLARGRSYLV